LAEHLAASKVAWSDLTMAASMVVKLVGMRAVMTDCRMVVLMVELLVDVLVDDWAAKKAAARVEHLVA